MLVAALTGATAAKTAAAQARSLIEQEPVLLPGDGVKITVYRRDEFSGTFQVNGDSTIAHPLYQAVKVAGLPMDTVDRRILDFLVQRGETDPQLLVEPLFRVVVAGEVNAPDIYEFGTGITIARAISLAGGVSQSGDLTKVRLVREGERIPINLRSPDRGLSRATVRSGDQVIVLKRINYVTDIILPAGGLVLALNQLYIGIRSIIGR